MLDGGEHADILLGCQRLLAEIVNGLGHDVQLTRNSQLEVVDVRPNPLNGLDSPDAESLDAAAWLWQIESHGWRTHSRDAPLWGGAKALPLEPRLLSAAPPRLLT